MSKQFPEKEDPINIFLEGMLTGDPGKAIEASEKRGQQAFNRSEVLPRKCNGCTRQQLEQMGIVFGEFADDMFIYCTLPAGWKKEPTEHSMWSKLLDDKGRERASIFYKAAFYDRDAFISLNRRYSYNTVPINGWEDKNYDKGEWHVVITDQGKVIHEIGKLGIKHYGDWKIMEPWFKAEEELKKLAQAYLKEHYPNWESELAYWD